MWTGEGKVTKEETEELDVSGAVPVEEEPNHGSLGDAFEGR